LILGVRSGQAEEDLARVHSDARGIRVQTIGGVESDLHSL
jgi:hypothetical protein